MCVARRWDTLDIHTVLVPKMGTVWEYQWEYTDLDNGQVKLYPFWLTRSEGLRSQTLTEAWGRCLNHTRRERVGPPEWREAFKVKPSGVKPLPEFEPPMHGELVELYRRERDPDVRRVILEVVRARRVMAEIEHLVTIIRREYGDGLVAMNLLRCLAQNERWRAGDFGNSKAGGNPGK
ncbi:hypothetical protein J4M90_37880 [Burkholderia contaminans]|jgi:hypothetical protein|uniref:Uncharacterized protein n=2 Tax=Bacteria TaxID=2 RepID=A0AAP1VBQ8_9BURK|nr:hypothetical protein [Burkholderia contaminans]MBH9693745.1 hypothetical protein [Burkholderia contaminans]MBK1905502.1 hypothetical protein [Burkholderia contaminans]MBK1913873.1 hypothetical protein [Burkholderia contaminans]MBK1927380.1 hypothetical protein [Burkholderia contaminans]